HRPDLIPPSAVDGVRSRSDGSYERRSFCRSDLSVIVTPNLASLALTLDGRDVVVVSDDGGDRVRVRDLVIPRVDEISRGATVEVPGSSESEAHRADIIIQNLRTILMRASHG